MNDFPLRDECYAFPFKLEEQNAFCPGMGLRDYFAAHAPPMPEGWLQHKGDIERVCVWRWAYSDEMMETRK